jgi:transposase
MIWAAIWGGNRSETIEMERDEGSKGNGFTKESYLKMLQQELPTIWEPGLPFMQDKASINTAKIIKKWLDETSIPVLEWPAISPDLNPIEHAWNRLKETIYELDPTLEIWKGDEDASIQRFRNVIEEAWTKIPADFLTSSSMPRRVEACIQAWGWYTRY